MALTHWGRVTHICVSNLTIIDSDTGLSPGRRQAIIWTNAGILLGTNLGTNFNEIVIEIHTFSFKKMHLNMSSEKWRPCFPRLQCVNCMHLLIKCFGVYYSWQRFPLSWATQFRCLGYQSPFLRFPELMPIDNFYNGSRIQWTSTMVPIGSYWNTNREITSEDSGLR